MIACKLNIENGIIHISLLHKLFYRIILCLGLYTFGSLNLIPFKLFIPSVLTFSSELTFGFKIKHHVC